MRMRYSLLLLLLLPAVVYAADSVIKEAFGIKLGEPLDVTGLELLSDDKTDTDGGEVYVFVPDHPYAPLNEYSVVVSPRTKTVYSVRAVGIVKNGSTCKAEMEKLAKVLTKKYGRRKPDPAAKFSGAPRVIFGSGSRRITVSCSGILFNYKLKLVYKDKSVDPMDRKIGGMGQEGGSRDTSGL